MNPTKEKATGVLPAPVVALQNQSNRSVVAWPGGVNRGIVRGSMLDAICGAGLVPHKALDLQPGSKT